jgi:toxic protein SymE
LLKLDEWVDDCRGIYLDPSVVLAISIFSFAASSTSFALTFEPAILTLPSVAINAAVPPAFTFEPRLIVCVSLESLRLLLEPMLTCTPMLGFFIIAPPVAPATVIAALPATATACSAAARSLPLSAEVRRTHRSTRAEPAAARAVVRIVGDIAEAQRSGGQGVLARVGVARYVRALEVRVALDATVRECDYKAAHNRGKYERLIPVPHIRLMGKWLQQAGFEPWSRVCVQVEDGRLIITPA